MLLHGAIRLRLRPEHLTFATKSAFFLLLLGFGTLAYLGGGVDFRGYYAAAILVRRGGNPYDYAQLAPVLRELTGLAGNNPYYYPPWFCLLFVPLTLVPFQVARAIWLLVSLVLFAIGLEQLRQALEWRPGGWQRWGAYCVAMLMFGAYCLRSEQAGILLLLGLALSLNAIGQGRGALVGLGLAIALTKPQATGFAVLVLALWLLNRKPAYVAWGVAWVAGLTAVASLAIPSWWRVSPEGFWQGLSYRLEGPGQIESVRVNATLYDFLAHVLRLPAPSWYPVAILVAIAAVGAIVVSWRRVRDVRAVAAASTLATLLLTPYALQYDYVPLTLPLFWVFSRMASLAPPARLAVTSLLVFSFSVLVWQAWSYQGYWQLLGVFAAFAVVLACAGAKHPDCDGSTAKG